MTVEFALRLASAAARVLAPDGGTALVGKDTRLSGYMMESALVAGFTSVGMDVVLTGPLPTPAIAMLTRELRADVAHLVRKVLQTVAHILGFRDHATTGAGNGAGFKGGGFTVAMGI